MCEVDDRGATVLASALDEHARLAGQAQGLFGESILQWSRLLADTLRAGRTVFWCGNGGSAADAQHLAAELVGRFQLDRPAYSSVALNVNSSILTSVANDYGFDEIFARQLQGLGREGDVLVALSTSGDSANVVRAVEVAGQLGMQSCGLLGREGGRLRALCDRAMVVPSTSTARIQEIHITIGHVLCELIENDLYVPCT